ncbi:MAG: hypothetical protein ACJ78Q_14575 [Chloroflexia bacterium]
MNDDTRDGIEALVLTDHEGAYYAIPRDTLGKYRLSDEQKAKIQDLAGDDVAGHLMNNWYVHENITAQYQSERREEASRERKVKANAAEPRSEDQQVGRAPGRMRGALTFVFTTLRSLSLD